MSKPEDVVRRYYEAFNARNLDAYADLFTPDCVVEAPGVSAGGVEAMRELDRAWTVAFPEARIETLRMATVGSFVGASNWLHGGKHEGVLHSPGGNIPPTGANFSAPYAASFEIEKGRIRLQRLCFDAASVPKLLGLG